MKESFYILCMFEVFSKYNLVCKLYLFYIIVNFVCMISHPLHGSTPFYKVIQLYQWNYSISLMNASKNMLSSPHCRFSLIASSMLCVHTAHSTTNILLSGRECTMCSFIIILCFFLLLCYF